MPTCLCIRSVTPHVLFERDRRLHTVEGTCCSKCLAGPRSVRQCAQHTHGLAKRRFNMLTECYFHIGWGTSGALELHRQSATSMLVGTLREPWICTGIGTHGP